MKITYYLDVVSSWCFWAEPAWAELKQRFAAKADFTWKIALLDGASLPATRAQEEWYYRRSGIIMRAPFLLNSSWYEDGLKEYLAPNAVAEAAKDLGVTDDRVRVAIAHAAMREGRKVGRWEEAAAVGAAAAGLNGTELLKRAKSSEVDARVRASTAEFHAFKMTQRPSFLLENNIGDRAVFSGVVVAVPIAATIEAMLNDAAAYASYAAHHGSAPPK